MPTPHGHVCQLVVGLADDQDFPLLSGLFQEPADEFVVPFREEEARVPVFLEEMLQDRVARGGSHHTNHELEFIFK